MTHQGIFRWFQSVGVSGSLTWAVYQAKAKLGQKWSSVTIKPRQVRYPVIARSGDTSDIDVFRQIFLLNEYACLRDIQSPHLILDLGANVGYSSAYFLSCFPTTTVVSVEPDPGNFALCRQNLAPYGNRSIPVLGAVWSKRTKLALSRKAFEWAIQVRASEDKKDEATVDAWDIPSLLQLAGKEHIDLLKVDIERSELEVFGASSSSWLPKVRNICIELHGEDCRKVFLKALRDFNYVLGNSGELTICRNLQRKAE
jgi:FkbM family methyltransferase